MVIRLYGYHLPVVLQWEIIMETNKKDSNADNDNKCNILVSHLMIYMWNTKIFSTKSELWGGRGGGEPVL